MAEKQPSSSKPYVIVIAGSVGSGKSTIAAALSKMLRGAPILSFDHYEKYAEWPSDMQRWMQNGFDPNQIHVPKLKEDLLALLEGQAITDPLHGTLIKPSTRYIIVEEPTGRERQEIREFIDLVVYIDVPQDICVVRLMERALNMNVWHAKGTFESESKENLVRQLDSVVLWITQYDRARSMYIEVSRSVRKNADIVIDGLEPIREVVKDILKKMKEIRGVFD